MTKWAHAKTEQLVEVFGSLCNVLTLLTSCKDARLLKTAAKFTGICRRIFGEGVGTNKKKKNTNKR